MKLARRYQVLPVYAYCAELCGWPGSVARPEDEVIDEAKAHSREAGHETRIVSTTQVIFGPDRAPAPAGAT